MPDKLGRRHRNRRDEGNQGAVIPDVCEEKTDKVERNAGKRPAGFARMNWSHIGVLIFACAALAGTALAGPLAAIDDHLSRVSLSRPVRGALGVWSLVGILLIHAGVCAAVIGWAHVLRAIAPRRITTLRALTSRRPLACFILGLLNWIVGALVLRALGRHAPGLSLLVSAALVFAAATGICGIIEHLGMRLSPPAAEDPSIRPGPVLWRGGIPLGLSLAIPLFGQALLVVILCIGLGASGLSLFGLGALDVSRPEDSAEGGGAQ